MNRHTLLILLAGLSAAACSDRESLYPAVPQSDPSTEKSNQSTLSSPQTEPNAVAAEQIPSAKPDYVAFIESIQHAEERVFSPADVEKMIGQIEARNGSFHRELHKLREVFPEDKHFEGEAVAAKKSDYVDYVEFPENWEYRNYMENFCGVLFTYDVTFDDTTGEITETEVRTPLDPSSHRTTISADVLRHFSPDVNSMMLAKAQEILGYEDEYTPKVLFEGLDALEIYFVEISTEEGRARLVGLLTSIQVVETDPSLVGADTSSDPQRRLFTEEEIDSILATTRPDQINLAESYDLISDELQSRTSVDERDEKGLKDRIVQIIWNPYYMKRQATIENREFEIDGEIVTLSLDEYFPIVDALWNARRDTIAWFVDSSDSFTERQIYSRDWAPSAISMDVWLIKDVDFIHRAQQRNRASAHIFEFFGMEPPEPPVF